MTDPRTAALNALARSAPWTAKQERPSDYDLGCIVRDFANAFGIGTDELPDELHELAQDATARDEREDARDWAEFDASRRIDARVAA